MPRFILGLTLLFWGWQTGLWIFAIPFALVVEAAPWWPSRWDFGDDDFKNIFNFCIMLFLIVGVYFFITSRNLETGYLFIRLQPIFFLLLLTTQLYSNRDRISILVFFPFLSGEQPAAVGVPFPSTGNLSTSAEADLALDLRYGYFGLCLIAASAANTPGYGFYLGMVALVMGMLWPGRSRRRGGGYWLLLMVLAATLGFGGSLAVNRIHRAFEQQVINWISDYYRQDADPYQRDTAIGELGNLKQSNAIAFRVSAADRARVPKLLREATYNRYQSPLWVATEADFATVQPGNASSGDPGSDISSSKISSSEISSNPPESTGSGQWLLDPSVDPVTLAQSPNRLTIAGNLREGKGLLKLPPGPVLLDPLQVKTVERNPYGTVRVEGSGGSLVYGVVFDPRRNDDAAPSEADLGLPPGERDVLEAVVAQLHLTEQQSQDVPDLLTQYFQQNFQYSLDLKATQGNLTPLSSFLLETRSGHCEYFATATTLLLRAAGIPSRYAIGFSVHEFSPLEQQFLVRTRHAHAWSLAYINGAWQTLDTTPGEWIEAENRVAPPWAFVGDWLSFAGFRWGLLWGQLKQINVRDYWWVLMIPLVVILLRQLDFQKQVQRLAVNPKATIAPPPDDWPGLDSELYTIEQVLAQADLARKPSETLGHWIDRLQSLPDASPHLQSLQPILDLHNRYRFDPQGLNTADRQRLRHLSTTWLQRWHQGTPV